MRRARPGSGADGLPQTEAGAKPDDETEGPLRQRAAAFAKKTVGGFDMYKVIIVAGAALLVAACQSDSQRDRALVGGGLGAATGAVIGSAIDGGGAGGAIVGAVVGGVGGAAIGSATTPKNCVATDRYGRRYRVACP